MKTQGANASPADAGSDEALFFCDACKERIFAYNRAAGVAVIPIGRHSTMHGISLSGDDVSSASAQARFETALASPFARIDRLWTWHRERVRLVLQDMHGNDARVPLDAYLDRVPETTHMASASGSSTLPRSDHPLAWLPKAYAWLSAGVPETGVSMSCTAGWPGRGGVDRGRAAQRHLADMRAR